MAVFALSDSELAAFLSFNDKFWPYFRDQVHDLDRLCNDIGSFHCDVRARRRGYIDRISTLSSPELRKRVVARLTALGATSTLEEQSRKGPVEEGCTHPTEAGFLHSSASIQSNGPDSIQLELSFE